MYHCLDIKLPMLGYEILVLSHSPNSIILPIISANDTENAQVTIHSNLGQINTVETS